MKRKRRRFHRTSGKREPTIDPSPFLPQNPQCSLLTRTTPLLYFFRNACDAIITHGGTVMHNTSIGIIEIHGIIPAIQEVEQLTSSNRDVPLRMKSFGDIHVIYFLEELSTLIERVDSAKARLQDSGTAFRSHIIPKAEGLLVEFLFDDTSASFKNGEIMMESLGVVQMDGFFSAIIAADVAMKTTDAHFLNIKFLHENTFVLYLCGEEAMVRSALASITEFVRYPGKIVEPHMFKQANPGLLSTILYGKTNVIKTFRYDDTHSGNTYVITHEASAQEHEYKHPAIAYLEKTTPRKKIRRSRKNPAHDPLQISQEEKLRLLQQCENLTVPQIRHVARTIPGLKIFGREISNANRVQLLEEIRQAFLLDDRRQDSSPR